MTLQRIQHRRELVERQLVGPVAQRAVRVVVHLEEHRVHADGDRRPGQRRHELPLAAGAGALTTGQLDEGIRVLEQVVEMQPHLLNANFILGVGYANAGRSDKALEAFGNVLRINPQFAEARKIVSSLKAFGKVTVNLK